MSRRPRREKRRLLGFHNPSGNAAGFILPVFEANDMFVMQRRDHGDRVVNFASLEQADITADEIFLSNELIEVAVGDPALHAFQTDSNEVIVGSRLDVAEILRQRIAEFSDRKNLLGEIASFIGAGERQTQRIRHISSRTPARSGLRDLKRLGQRLRRRTTFDTSDLGPVLSEFAACLPGAIEDVTNLERRSAFDVLRDLTWAVEHNLEDIREAAQEQEIAANEGDLTELWIVAHRILDLRTDFYPTVLKNLKSKVLHTYFIHDDSQLKRLCEKIVDDLGEEYLEYISGVRISGGASELLFMTEFALWNPLEPDSIVGKTIIRNKDIRFIPLSRQHALSRARILWAVREKAKLARGMSVEMSAQSLFIHGVDLGAKYAARKNRV